MKNRVGPRPAVVVLIVGSLFPACGASVNGEVPAAPVALSNEKAVRLPKRAAAFAASATVGSPAYKIGPQDVLDVSVFKAPELTRSVQVADTGTINLPLVGEVQAGGRTAQEIERDLAKRLGVKYMQAPQVTVYIKEYNSQRVTVEGAVKRPGVYPLRGKTTLMQSLAVAGGLDETSDSNVIIFRQTEGKRYAARFDIEEIRAGKADDPVVEQGDMIVVNSSTTKAAWQHLLQALPLTRVFLLLI